MNSILFKKIIRKFLLLFLLLLENVFIVMQKKNLSLKYIFFFLC